MFQNTFDQMAIIEALNPSDPLKVDTVRREPEGQSVRTMLSTWDATVRVLVNAVEAKSPYTRGHSERVMLLSTVIGQELGLSEATIETLARGAMLHDIGKIGIPDSILEKPGKLTETEFDVIKMHPVIGDLMLANVPEMESIRHIVRHHHEKLDGSGYPDNLRGSEIQIEARIVAVADIYDALLSNRSYRAGMNPTQAMELLFAEVSAGRLDLKVVRALADILESIGRSDAELSD